jgi:hyperosmotically inducible periplasmic protein
MAVRSHHVSSRNLVYLRSRLASGAGACCRAAALVAALLGCTTGALHSTWRQWKIDDELAERVEDALLEARQLNLSHVDVDVENGVVYLIGEMDTSDNKIRAHEIAMSIPGVKTVVNKLEVEP